MNQLACNLKYKNIYTVQEGIFNTHSIQIQYKFNTNSTQIQHEFDATIYIQYIHTLSTNLLASKVSCFIEKHNSLESDEESE